MSDPDRFGLIFIGSGFRVRFIFPSLLIPVHFHLLLFLFLLTKDCKIRLFIEMPFLQSIYTKHFIVARALKYWKNARAMYKMVVSSPRHIPFVTITPFY